MCALTDLGLLFSCGKCEYTGHGTRQDVLEPLLLDAFGGVPVRYETHTYTCLAYTLVTHTSMPYPYKY